ncbi:hypothetical protein SAMN05660668_02706 [Pseudobutyrivibrio sp. AR14]|uniref:hypothetical protein n=1 Tax=Pseudobutyrivibrio sp. AR14 TaxID=1520804 RepID=UPI000883F579|nr:hypothetical protein [Pseudobutyrivibrio sp. AR14]SCY45761.1 hypothetical protein SAMN05660668_02706 [Pseudobutyrivibrio sp. AR14]
MPVHLDSFIPEKKIQTIISGLVSMVNSSSVVCASEDKTIIHLQTDLIDDVKNMPFGRAVFTLKVDDVSKKTNVIDIDIVLENNETTKLDFIKKLSKSSEANEYYDADVVEGGRIQIETVNRNAFHGELEGKTHEVRLSAFPFSVDVFDSMDEINKRFSQNSKIEDDGTERKVAGYADTFVCPGSIFHLGVESDDTFTYFFGRVSNIRNIECSNLGESFSFYIVDVVSGMGNIPVAISPECFDLRKLDIGKVLEIRADIKADFIDDVRK